MYILIHKKENTPLALNFIQEKEIGLITFDNNKQAKQFWRARRLKEYKLEWVDTKELIKLKNIYEKKSIKKEGENE